MRAEDEVEMMEEEGMRESEGGEEAGITRSQAIVIGGDV